MGESIQGRLGRLRPPRVRISYDRETHGSLIQEEIPFIIGVFAPLSGSQPRKGDEVSQRKMLDIDRDNFDEVLSKIGPEVELGSLLTDDMLMEMGIDPSVKRSRTVTFNDPNRSSDDVQFAGIKFSCLDDFAPDSIIRRIDELRQVDRKRTQIRDLQAMLENAPQFYEAVCTLLGQCIDDLPPLGTASDEERIKYNEFTGLMYELTEKFRHPEDIENWANATLNELKSLFELMQTASSQDETARNKILLGRLYWEILRPATVEINSLSNDAEQTKKLEQLKETTLFDRFDQRVSSIDRILSHQLDAILHHAEFMQLEATWRGLAFLVFRAETGSKLKIRVVNLTENELKKDLERAVELDQSYISKLIVETEYGTYDGTPYSLLVGDYEFDDTADKIDFLKNIAQLAASAHAPFIASSNFKSFNLGGFDDSVQADDLKNVAGGVNGAIWRSFSEMEDSRYVSLTVPKVLLRLPYQSDFGQPVEYYDISENVLRRNEQGDVEGVEPDHCLWGNAAFILAERISNAFSLYGWAAAIRGEEGGGLIETLPSFEFKASEGQDARIGPTQGAITDHLEKELTAQDFFVLCVPQLRERSTAAFFARQATDKPRSFLDDHMNANSALSSSLASILCASRFAIYIKVLMREKIGTFMTRSNVEAYLNAWIAEYILLDDEATQDAKAAYPLRSATIKVRDNPGKPGSYKATLFVRPHFQLEGLTESVRLVIELPG
ncbi:MAG: type VI secretion system contractile sheath large subunit, partial [Pseudomonadales bacterium]